MPLKSVFWGTLQPQLPHLQPDLPSFFGLGQTFVSEKRVFYLPPLQQVLYQRGWQL